MISFFHWQQETRIVHTYEMEVIQVPKYCSSGKKKVFNDCIEIVMRHIQSRKKRPKNEFKFENRWVGSKKKKQVSNSGKKQTNKIDEPTKKKNTTEQKKTMIKTRSFCRLKSDKCIQSPWFSTFIISIGWWLYPLEIVLWLFVYQIESA